MVKFYLDVSAMYQFQNGEMVEYSTSNSNHFKVEIEIEIDRVHFSQHRNYLVRLIK